MKNAVFPIIVVLLVVFQVDLLAAEEQSSHSAYRVTSYNLGAILNTQGDGDVQSSGNLRPLLITGSSADILYSEHEGTVTRVATKPHTSNIEGVAVSAQFDATQNISVLGSFGLTRNLWTPDSIDYDNKSSWEANLGIIYKLLGNLSYELHLGYMDTGDLFNNKSSYGDIESIIMVSNRLTMSF